MLDAFFFFFACYNRWKNVDVPDGHNLFLPHQKAAITGCSHVFLALKMILYQCSPWINRAHLHMQEVLTHPALSPASLQLSEQTVMHV